MWLLWLKIKILANDYYNYGWNYRCKTWGSSGTLKNNQSQKEKRQWIPISNQEFPNLGSINNLLGSTKRLLASYSLKEWSIWNMWMDSCDCMKIAINKWKLFFDVIMQARLSPCLKDHTSCKDKWGFMNGDFKNIFDYHARIGFNEWYCNMPILKHLKVGLPK